MKYARLGGMVAGSLLTLLAMVLVAVVKWIGGGW